MKRISWDDDDGERRVGEIIAAVKDSRDVTWLVVHCDDSVVREIRADEFQTR